MVEKAGSYPASTGLVTGLTNLTEEVLKGILDVPLLIPGLGAQGGQLDVLKGSGRTAPLLINSSRGILFGQEGTCADRARGTMEKIRAVLA